MTLANMDKEKALEVYRVNAEVQKEVLDYILEGIIDWDLPDVVGDNFGHQYKYKYDSYWSADIDATYEDGKIVIDVFGKRIKDEAYYYGNDEDEESYFTFLADASDYIGKDFTDVEEAEKAIKEKLEKQYNEMLTESHLEYVFTENYEWLFEDYEVEEA